MANAPSATPAVIRIADSSLMRNYPHQAPKEGTLVGNVPYEKPAINVLIGRVIALDETRERGASFLVSISIESLES